MVKRGKVLLLSALAVLAACAGNPRQVNYEVTDSRVLWLDVFHAEKRVCGHTGGVIFHDRPAGIHCGHGSCTGGPIPIPVNTAGCLR